ncbi:MAG: hypothetical protein CSA11_06045 [Chloroflexi bacterium]|nr:MAG: hypothetical protein CSA11_06045 [Chloroflexota bacterium]
MKNSKFYPVFVSLVALMIVVGAVALGWRLWNGDSSLLRNVTVQHEQITPNADGDSDVTRIQYELSRNAVVSIYFENEAGDRFYFRQDKDRGAGDYEVLFSGVVDGYLLPDEEIQGEVLARLLRDGKYTWTIEAVDEKGIVEMQQGQILIVDADPDLPELRNFTLDRETFTPNRDGINDRVKAQFYQTKEADVRVFLLTPAGLEVPISELERDVPAGTPGRHYYDYEGGVDNGETPPPDGTYPIVAIASDAEGQRMQVTNTLTLEYGGVPRADIFAPPTGDTLAVNTTAVTICDTLYFTMTVENYGNTPIRTSGPEPGTVYDSDWNYNTLGWHTESGVFRAAIGYENELGNYPYRWAVGGPEDLTQIGAYNYLMPGDRAIVTGGIRLVNVFGNRNPQPLWAGLIHEDVEITPFNTHVDPKAIWVDIPDEAHLPDCEAREIPVKNQ